MYIRFSRGFAFIVEGPTEKVFYTQLLKYLAQKYTIELNSGYGQLPTTKVAGLEKPVVD